MKLFLPISICAGLAFGAVNAEPSKLACKFDFESTTHNFIVDEAAGTIQWGNRTLPIVFSSDQRVQATRLAGPNSKNVYSNTIIIDKFSGRIVEAFAGLSCTGENCQTKLNSSARQGTCTRAIL